MMDWSIFSIFQRKHFNLLMNILSKSNPFSLLSRSFLYGLLMPLSFSPFHIPGAAILGLAFFYAQITHKQNQRPFLSGFFFGLGYFGLGVSWIFVSIHQYGHLNYFLSAFLTLLFLMYLSLFIGFMAFLFKQLTSTRKHTLFSGLLFSALWVLFEYFRSTLFSGFPWLLIGFGQFDAPSKYLLPIIGVFGVGFLTCFSATLLTNAIQQRGTQRQFSFLVLVLLVLSPLLLKTKHWSQQNQKAMSVGIIQANLSMRDKWDERLFWQVLKRYQQGMKQLLGLELIVMPESAIPLPANYMSGFLTHLHAKAIHAGSAVMLGIPQPTKQNSHRYFNALISLGEAKGGYLKQHLVPFGEYIPKPLQTLSKWLEIPDAHLMAGHKNQLLVNVQKHPIATLICYELAYSDLLRHQLPQAEWIVSISDDGWFGHSLAMYQQLQIAQVRSLEVARYHVVANNDGLSSVINANGEVINSLPAFNSGLLKAKLLPMTGTTPWVYWGNRPILLFCALILMIAIAANHKRRYSNQPD